MRPQRRRPTSPLLFALWRRSRIGLFARDRPLAPLFVRGFLDAALAAAGFFAPGRLRFAAARLATRPALNTPRLAAGFFAPGRLRFAAARLATRPFFTVPGPDRSLGTNRLAFLPLFDVALGRSPVDLA